MARYQAILAYDGTDFSGFQRQARKIKDRTVQGLLEEALSKVGWTGNSILSAGRTDSGVHASGQVIAFDLQWLHPTDRLLAALNTHLPSDMAVRDLKMAAPDFHPRFDAISRSYEYRLFIDPVRDPRRERYAWRIWPEVDLERMSEAAAGILGAHDFRSFGTAPNSRGSTVRTIFQANWITDSSDLVFQIRGNAFLYRMVRKLVGLLVEIGHGKVEPPFLSELLKVRSPEAVKMIAPPQGLTLVAVEYLA